MAANSSEPSTASAYDSAPPPFRRPCSRCEKIVIYNPDFTLSSSLDTIRRQQHGTVVRYGLVIDGSARVLGEGLDDNCQFCKVIRDHHETSANYETLESPHLTAIFQDENDTFSEISGNTQDSVMAMFGQHCVQAFASRTGDFVLSVEPYDQVARILKKGPPLPFLGSDQAFHTVKYWIQDCFTNHGVMCKHNAADSISISISSPRFLPKRIIDVGSTDLRLCQPAQETVGDYVALSYCWGRRPQVVLTQKVAESADFCFLMHTLPPTIRDAIIICRRLGFQYLWVDALCIIQDSPDSKDWIEQSARMDEIYGNAALTIAAASGSSVWDGILKPTTDVPISVCSMPFTFRTDVRGFNTPPSKLAGSQVSVRFYPYNIDARQPLSLRAWTFQEEVLSPQILKFHKEQLVWQCRSSKIYFDGPVNNRQIQVLKTWEEAVAEYTKRNMTVDNDRLVAVAGYVRSKHKEFEAHGIVNRYFAGLWEKNLVDHLLWISKVKPPLPRPTSYRAPTWSWASINGPVEFVTEERKGMRFAHVTIKLLDHFLATNPANPFGTLDKYPASFIHIKGNLKAVPEMEIPSKNKPFPANKDLRKGIGRHWWIEFDVIDVEERIELARTNNSISRNPYRDPKTLYCLRVTEFTALILAPVVRREEVKWFERVGLVKHWQRAKWTWFDDIEEKTELYLI